MKVKFLGLILLSVFLTSCSMVEKDSSIKEVANYTLTPDGKPPIIQIKQSLNISAEQNIETISLILKNNNIKVVNQDSSNNSFESDWIYTTDYICTGYKLSNAPLNCRTKLYFKVSEIHSEASTVNIMLKEICNSNEDVLIRCPGSKGEKMMFAVLEDLKSVAE